jgi:hypothetical protein
MIVVMVDQKTDNMCSFFHTVLFAYQKSLKEILGSGEATFIHPILKKIILVIKKQNRDLLEEENIDKFLENFLEELLKKGTVKWIDFEEVEDGKYLFHVEGCQFAKHIHDFLNTKDTTCPLALAVMAFLQVSTGKKVLPTESEYTHTGTKTLIEFFEPTKTELTATILDNNLLSIQ